MKLVIDNVIYRWQSGGGISTVWYELSKRIIDQLKDYLFVEYPNSNKNKLRSLLEIPSSKLYFLNDKFFFLKKYLPIRLNVQDPFIFHSTYYRSCLNKNAVNIVTVHDFTYEYFRRGLSKKIHCLTKYKAIREADYIVCISNNTKNDLLKFLPDIKYDKIRVIYNGVSDIFKPTESGKKNFLLYVGGRDEYKNFKLVVLTAAEVRMPLVICGGNLTEEETSFLNRIIPNGYKFLGFVSEEKLNEYYNSAFALLYPSAYEGFGIPVLEAQKAGCPVIAYNASSIPEIIGESPLLMKELTVKELASKIKLLADDNIRDAIIKEGIINSMKFNWNNAFEQYKQLYREIESKTNKY